VDSQFRHVHPEALRIEGVLGRGGVGVVYVAVMQGGVVKACQLA
jgi:hypothetical protein